MACLCSSYGRAETITETSLKAFSYHLQELSYQSPDYLYPFLADDLIVEINLGSNAQGVSMVFNKSEYMARLKKKYPAKSYKENLKYLDVRSYDHVVTSPSSGRFSIVTYSRATRVKTWGVYDIEQQGDKLKIVKITEDM
ncbi:hypothetical protein FE810_05525 [Thalassotalea litorea]|uniref:Nuclear transport factor 2 family protein n=1 Tax=Thalassotalea litorea TaxID=2020715 RepID=A0A5R9IKX8_9GAMM|nr:hypothetical protein [Thalassotalea litorea]TLU66180.1 hypothetical protein FE810_05525 [Thalassotalea litorea]